MIDIERTLRAQMEEDLNVLARFIGRAVGVSGDMDALEALTAVKRELAAAGRFEDEVRDIMDGMGASEFYQSFNKALRRLQDARQ